MPRSREAAPNGPRHGLTVEEILRTCTDAPVHNVSTEPPNGRGNIREGGSPCSRAGGPSSQPLEPKFGHANGYPLDSTCERLLGRGPRAGRDCSGTSLRASAGAIRSSPAARAHAVVAPATAGGLSPSAEARGHAATTAAATCGFSTAAEACLQATTATSGPSM